MRRTGSDRIHAVDSGRDVTFRGVDQGITRQSYTCSATCRCGTRVDADSLTCLRDCLALHVIDCSGRG